MKEDALGPALEEARLEKGLSREVLARELNISVQTLEAIESERWAQLSEGLQRPIARQLAERLGVATGKAVSVQTARMRRSLETDRRLIRPVADIGTELRKVGANV